ncbi:hypothetical protein ABE073_04795 [Lederbergia citrisecunda]|uniref:hypothetical protein n=1 Tax=Lederbergia citrisecunda TaxID=2833583 RepID=UPI003D2DCF8E
MKEYRVTKILREPKLEALRLDHVTIEYWSVAVVLKGNSEEYESAVTFETLKKAQQLQIGDVFLR